MAKLTGTDTYPVGVLRAIQTASRAIRCGRWDIARSTVRSAVRYLKERVNERNWRAVRNSFNGYLAEHDGHPHNCGTGWTKRIAERRAERLCCEVRNGSL